jgi:ABC-type multidrug transport system ATPase subunit
LLKALCAREPATSGEVWVGGENLSRDFEMLKADIALVPQYDLAYDSLTPREALRYTAKLRLPADTGDGDVQQQVERVLQSVGLTANGGPPNQKAAKRAKQLEPAATRISRLSGGQRKRVSLANETVCRPNLLFLDEVTSGLDEETDWKIMRLCRQMADDGITIICVTHTLVNVEEFCDQIVVLAKPGESEAGELVFSGSPKDALRFFSVPKLGDIYRKLEPGKSGTNLAEWQQRSLEKGYRQENALPETHGEKGEKGAPAKGRGITAKMIRAEAVRQLLILTRRNLSLLSRDLKTLAIALAQSLMIAILLILAFEKMDAAEQYSLLFLLGISAFWLGCNNASKEIVKERPIYLQERNVNLSVQAYLAAKVGVSSLLATIQSLILVGTVLAFRDVPGQPTAQMVLIVLAALCGSALGLLISSACATRDQANTMVPLALVPQIILGGAIVPVLPELAEEVAKVGISQYWIYEGLKKTSGDFEFRRLLASVWAQLGHMVFFLGAAFAVIYYRDRRG